METHLAGRDWRRVYDSFGIYILVDRTKRPQSVRSSAKIDRDRTKMPDSVRSTLKIGRDPHRKTLIRAVVLRLSINKKTLTAGRTILLADV